MKKIVLDEKSALDLTSNWLIAMVTIIQTYRPCEVKTCW